MNIESQLIIEVNTDYTKAENFSAMIRDHESSPDVSVNFMVMRTRFNEKTFFVALAGGKIENDEVLLTPTGEGAVHTLKALKNDWPQFIFHELSIGSISILDKIVHVFLLAQDGAGIVMIGDFKGELDGIVSPHLNITGYINEMQVRQEIEANKTTDARWTYNEITGHAEARIDFFINEAQQHKSPEEAFPFESSAVTTFLFWRSLTLRVNNKEDEKRLLEKLKVVGFSLM